MRLTLLGELTTDVGTQGLQGHRQGPRRLSLTSPTLSDLPDPGPAPDLQTAPGGERGPSASVSPIKQQRGPRSVG